MTEYNDQDCVCPNCGNVMVIRQDKNHSEYTPMGKCGKCSNVYAVIHYMTGKKELVNVTQHGIWINPK